MTNNANAATHAAVVSHADLLPIALAMFIGVGLIFVAGFSHASALHDTAHDARHAVSFPCH